MVFKVHVRPTLLQIESHFSVIDQRLISIVSAVMCMSVLIFRHIELQKIKQKFSTCMFCKAKLKELPNMTKKNPKM